MDRQTLGWLAAAVGFATVVGVAVAAVEARRTRAALRPAPAWPIDAEPTVAELAELFGQDGPDSELPETSELVAAAAR